MTDFDDFGGLEGNAQDLNETLASTGSLVAGFDNELPRRGQSRAHPAQLIIKPSHQ